MSDLRTPWRAVAAMFILNGALLGIWASRIPSVAETHALGHDALGFLLLLLAGGALAAFPVAGRFADRRGAAPVTRVIAVAYVVALGLIALAPNLPLLAVALFIFGATHGAMDVTMNAWAGDVERQMRRSVMSSFHAMFSLGLGVGAASGYVAESVAATLFWHAVIAGGAVAVITLWVASAPDVQGTPAATAPDAGPMFRLPRGTLFLVGLVAFCSSLGEGGTIDWNALYLTEVTGASAGDAALGLTAFSVAMVAMRLAGDHLIRRLGPVMSARLAGTLAAAGAALLATGPGYTVALGGFVLMGLGYAVVMPLAFSRAANDPDLPPGAAIASVSTLGYGGLLLGPPVIGFVAEWTSLQGSFALLAVLAVAILALSGALRR